MNFRTLALLLLLPAAALRLSADGPVDADPSIALTHTTVTISSITPGDHVVLFSLGLAGDGYGSTVQRVAEVLTDDDHDGVVTYTPSGGVPFRSVWVAVDAQSERFAVASPTGFRAPGAHLPKQFRKTGGTVVDEIGSPGPFLDVLYVKPDGSAWTTYASDGMKGDLDLKSNGVTTVRADHMSALGTGGQQPTEFAIGGILVIGDLYSMEIYAVKLDATVLGGN